MLTLVDVTFPSSIFRFSASLEGKGMFKIADVFRRVAFLLFLLCSRS